MWVIKLLIIIGGLFYLYSQSNKEEEFIGLKLIGYYLLGAFLFIFNDFRIPLGFLIFLIFFRPVINRATKAKAAYLGVVLLLVGIVSPILSNYYFERPVKVAASSSNIYMLDMNEDWLNIQQRMGNPRNIKIEYLKVDYEEDGEIRDFSLDLVGSWEDGMVLYRVRLSRDKQTYLINAKKVDQWHQYGRLASADRFIDALQLINLEEVVNQGEKLAWYVVESSGEFMTSSETTTHFMYQDGKMILVGNSDLPISGFSISLYGMREISKTSTSGQYIGTNRINYWFQQW